MAFLWKNDNLVQLQINMLAEARNMLFDWFNFSRNLKTISVFF